MKYTIWLLLFALLCPTLSNADDKKKEVTFGGFLDTYYAYDFNRPAGDRQFTTTASRHNEFSINLAYVDVRLERDRVRGRLALQAGSSVYSNYSAERRYGAAQGPELADFLSHLQEAYAGYRLTEKVWIDAGLFLSHIGAETFISKDNWNYTRSLGADFTPYYQAGLRLSYQASPTWFMSLHLLNGWQNAIENNGGKALGLQVAYTPTDAFSITYNNFLGDESGTRFFNNLIFKTKLSGKTTLSFSSDLGFQKKAAGTKTWFVETLLGQYRLSETLALGGRLEYFNDQSQVLVLTTTPNGFQTFGASLNLDWQPEAYLLVRNEVRSLLSKDAVFTGAAGARTSSTLFVTSVALTF